MTQHIIVFCVVALCVAYVAYRVIYAFRHAHDRCYGCQLKQVCNKHGKGRKAISPRRNRPGHGQSGSPCSDYVPRDNNGTDRHGTLPLDHHSGK